MGVSEVQSLEFTQTQDPGFSSDFLRCYTHLRLVVDVIGGDGGVTVPKVPANKEAPLGGPQRICCSEGQTSDA